MDLADLSEPYRRYLAAVTTYHHAVASAVGLGASDYQALNLLELAADGMSIGDLARSTGLTHSAATRMVDRLEAGGYIERSTDPTDRRRAVIRVGSATPPALAAALGAVRGHVAPAFASLGGRELEVLKRYFLAATEGFANARDDIAAHDID